MPRTRRLLAAAVLTGGLSLGTQLPASAAPNAQDRTWMAAAHQSNLSEIAAGQAAQQEATSATVKELGQMFITHHTEMDAKLRQLAGQLQVSLPGSPSAAQQASLAAVTQNDGTSFDRAWISQQLASHLQTMAITKTELANGSDTQVVAAARAASPIVARHYAELRKAAGGASGVNSGTGGQAASSGSTPLTIGLTGAGVLLLVGSGIGYARTRRSTG